MTQEPARRASTKARLPAAERRQQLLDVALATFSSQGYGRTSMNDIAEAAGVTKPVLYQHFGSKRALFLELLRDLGGRLREEMGKSVAAAASPHQQVAFGMRAYFGWVAEHRQGFEILFSGESGRDAEFHAEVMKVEADIADSVAALILIDGIDEERQRQLAYGIVGMAERVARYWVQEHPETPADQLAAQVTELAWNGLRGLRAV
jgi:AcrR family transcriptional regulator